VKSTRSAAIFFLAITALTLPTGCADNSLPGSLQLLWPDGSNFEAPLGSGAPSLANSTWDVFPGPILGPAPIAIARVTFGDAGQVVSFEAAPDFVGSIPTDLPGITTMLIADGVPRDLVPGVSYVGGAYGGQTGANIAITAFFRYSAGPVKVAEVTLAIAGEQNADRIDGTFAFNVTLEGPAADFLPGVGTGPQATQLPIILKPAP
jgi:hypothetical protein